MSQENNADIRRLLDIQEIADAKARYGILVDGLVARPDDAAALDELDSLFTADAAFNFGGRIGTFSGKAALRRFYGAVLPGERQWVWHSFSNPLIEVRGDEATAQWTIYALAVSKGIDPWSQQVICGRYRDSHVRTPAGWRQSALIFIAEGLEGQ